MNLRPMGLSAFVRFVYRVTETRNRSRGGVDTRVRGGIDAKTRRRVNDRRRGIRH